MSFGQKIQHGVRKALGPRLLIVLCVLGDGESMFDLEFCKNRVHGSAGMQQSNTLPEVDIRQPMELRVYLMTRLRRYMLGNNNVKPMVFRSEAEG